MSGKDTRLDVRRVRAPELLVSHLDMQFITDDIGLENGRVPQPSRGVALYFLIDFQQAALEVIGFCGDSRGEDQQEQCNQKEAQSFSIFFPLSF